MAFLEAAPANRIPCDLVGSYYVLIRAGLQSAAGLPKARSGPTGAHGAPRLTPGPLEAWAAVAAEHRWLPWRPLMPRGRKARAPLAAPGRLQMNEKQAGFTAGPVCLSHAEF